MADGHEGLAGRFTAALEASDADALRQLYTDDAVFWHSADQRTMSADEVLDLARGLREAVDSCEIAVDKRFRIDGGFLQTQTSRYVFRSGEIVTVLAALIAKVEPSGLISRIDEYIDSKELTALLDAVRQAKA